MDGSTPRRAQKGKKTRMESLLAFSGQAEDHVVMEERGGSLLFKTELGKQSSGPPAEAGGTICCHIQQLHRRDML